MEKLCVGGEKMVFKVAIPGKIQFKMYRKEPGFFLTRQGDIHYIGGSEVLNFAQDFRHRWKRRKKMR